MGYSSLTVVTASIAAVAMIVSLATSPALARGGGGHFGGGHFGSGETFTSGGFAGGGLRAGGGFHSGGRMYGGFHAHSRFLGGCNACIVNPYDQLQNPANPPYSSPYMC